MSWHEIALIVALAVETTCVVGFFVAIKRVGPRR